MLRPCAEPLPENTLRRAAALSVTLLCDGAKASGLNLVNDGCMSAAMKPIVRGMKMLGTALTVETAGGDIFPLFAALDCAREGYIMVIDGGGCTDRAYCGDIVFSCCQAVGLAGLAIDGYVRDADGTAELAFPVFSTGVIPRPPVRERGGKVNIPILCCGVPVCPGDLVMGDSDGVCAIPRRQIETVLAHAEEKAKFEKSRREMVSAYRRAKAAGAPLPPIIPPWAQAVLKELS